MGNFRIDLNTKHMKNLILITLLICSAAQLSFAQAGNIEYSAPFDEPEDGWRKVLQLSNGNTFFFNYYGKDGILIKVFNKSRKLTSEKEVMGSKWEPKAIKTTKICGLYEIGGHPVLFIQQVIKRTPHLYRMVFDANTGSLISEELVATLQKYHLGMEYAVVYGGVEIPTFHVEKSISSDDYVVVNFNSISPESDERIEVVHYNANGRVHNVKSKAYYDAQGFKYVNYVASCVTANSVYICAYGFNTKNSGGEDSRIIISRLDKGSSDFTHKKMEFTDDFQDTRGILALNEGSGMLQLFTLTFMKKTSSMWKGTRSTYLPVLSLIDPQSLTIIKANPFASEFVSAHVKEKFNEKNPFSGMPQHMIINKDYTTTIVQEEMSKVQQQQANGKFVTTQTQLGNIGLTELDKTGKETIGYAAKKSQNAGGDISGFNLWDRDRGIWSPQVRVSFGSANTPFFSFDYVNTAKGKYLIFNDYPENFHKKESEDTRTVNAASGMNTVYYELKNGFFEKHFLYHAPKGDDDLKFANIESANFDDATNTYAALIVAKDGRKKEAHIAWVKFE